MFFKNQDCIARLNSILRKGPCISCFGLPSNISQAAHNNNPQSPQSLQTMLDEILLIGPSSKNSYYFQIVPLFLTLVGKETELPAQGTTYRFSVHKGHHKFDQNRHPIQAHFSTNKDSHIKMPVSVCKLNFYIPHYLQMRNHQFLLKMTQHECSQDFQVGEYLIDAGQFVEEYLASKKRRFSLKTFFSGEYELDFEIFLEKSRKKLEELVKRSEQFMEDPEMKQEGRINHIPIGRRNRAMTITKTVDKIKLGRWQSNEHFKSSEKARERMAELNTTPIKHHHIIIKDEHRQTEINIDNSLQNKPASLPNQDESQPIANPKPVNLFKMYSNDSQPIDSPRVPLIHTKFKQLAKADVPHQVKMSESQRLSGMSGFSMSGMNTGIVEEGSSNRMCIIMWVYIGVCLGAIYFAMHPAYKL